MRRHGCPILLVVTSLVAQAPVPPDLTRAIGEFRTAVANGDAAACQRALAAVPGDRRGAAALAMLRPQAAAVPLAALVPFASRCADLMPWGTAADREAAATLVEALGARAEAFREAVGRDQLPELANQLARIWNRARVDAQGDLAALRRQVEEAFEQCREAACEALAARGPAAAAAVDDLLHLLQRQLPPNGHDKLLGEYYPMRDQPRLAAARALVAIAPGDPRTVAAHAYLLEQGTSAERRAAAAALGEAGSHAAAAVPALIAATSAADVELVRGAVLALGQLGATASSAAARLTELAAGADRQTAAMAKAALRQLTAGAAR